MRSARVPTWSSAHVLDLIPPGRKVSIEREVFPRLVGQGLYGRRLEGYWMDIGTPQRYLQASWDILEGAVETEVGRDRSPGSTSRRGGCRRECGDRAAGGGAAGLQNRRGCAGRALQYCWKNARVGAAAVIENAILAAGVSVGEGATIGNGSIVGEGAVIEAGVELPGESRVQPGAVVGVEAVAS